MPRSLICLFAWTMVAGAARAGDARAVITQDLQILADAVSNGDAKAWETLLDPAYLSVDEAGAISGKAETVKQIVPLPKGISGTIKVELVRYHEEGALAVAVVRQHETEHYFGQTLHAEYLTSTTWVKRGRDWRLVAQQTLAELVDPPSIALPASRVADYPGIYRLRDGDLVTTLAVTEGKLTAARAGRPGVTLDAEAADVFFVAGQPRTRRIFQRDDTGRVTGFVDRREGRDVVWVRQ